MISQTNRKKSFLLLACALGFLLLSTQQAKALDGNAPIIVAITPGEGAAGFGQLVTIQGFNIYNPLNPTLTQVTFTQGGITANAFVFSSPSNPNEVYVRLPFTLTPGRARVRVTTLDDNLTSNAVRFRVRAKPGTPIPRKIIRLEFPSNPTITSAAPGDQIGIQAYGTDTALVTAIFRQGATELIAPLDFGADGRDIGEVSVFTVPGLSPGPAIVQIRVTVNGANSDLSFPLLLTITP
jgi:hypothetical protein